jgi:hypothetical protein
MMMMLEKHNCRDLESDEKKGSPVDLAEFRVLLGAGWKVKIRPQAQ